MDAANASNATNSSSSEELPAYLTFVSYSVVLFAIICIFLNIITAYLLFTNPKLRVAPYIFIGSWAVSDAVVLLYDPCFLSIVDLMDQENVSWDAVQFVYQSMEIFDSTTMLFVIAVAVDWYFSVNFLPTSLKFREKQKSVVRAVWMVNAFIHLLVLIVPFFEITTLVGGCFHILTFLVLLLVMSTMWLTRSCQKCRRLVHPPHMLILTTLLTAACVLGMLEYFHMDALFLVWTFARCGFLMKAVVTFFGLNRWSRDFHHGVLDLMENVFRNCRRY